MADKELVEDMALPDSIALSRANQTTLNTCSLKEIGIGAYLALLFRKVASDQLIERWFHVKLSLSVWGLRKGR